MYDIWNGISAAIYLLATFDRDLVEITLRSLQVTLSAVVISSAIALPLGAWSAIRRFRLRRTAIAVLNALMGLSAVAVGLVVYLLLSHFGPFGVFDLLFTPTAMIIAQVIIITPLIASDAHQATRKFWAEYHDLLISMNATSGQRIRTLTWDRSRALITASLAGLGRAIGEVGAIMMRRSVRDNLTYPHEIRGASTSAAKITTEGWAKRINLTHALDQPAPNLSGGEKQKGAVGRVLIREPQLVFLDEPCANLDGRATQDIEAMLLTERDARRTIAMSTHNLGQARRLASRVVFMLGGCVHETGPADDFFHALQTEAAASFLKGDIV